MGETIKILKHTKGIRYPIIKEAYDIFVENERREEEFLRSAKEEEESK